MLPARKECCPPGGCSVPHLFVSPGKRLAIWVFPGRTTTGSPGPHRPIPGRENLRQVRPGLAAHRRFRPEKDFLQWSLPCLSHVRLSASAPLSNPGLSAPNPGTPLSHSNSCAVAWHRAGRVRSPAPSCWPLGAAALDVTGVNRTDRTPQSPGRVTFLAPHFWQRRNSAWVVNRPGGQRRPLNPLRFP
jgi:hypothetical protein